MRQVYFENEREIIRGRTGVPRIHVAASGVANLELHLAACFRIMAGTHKPHVPGEVCNGALQTEQTNGLWAYGSSS